MPQNKILETPDQKLDHLVEKVDLIDETLRGSQGNGGKIGMIADVKVLKEKTKWIMYIGTMIGIAALIKIFVG